MKKAKNTMLQKVEDKRRKQINKAASTYLSDQSEGDLYDAYVKLLEASEASKGDDRAADFVEVWQPLENSVSVDEMIHLIEDSIEKPELPDFMKKIDWKLLQQQKAILLTVINKDEINPREKEGLEGILNLIDSLQDSAVDDFELAEDLVFSEDEEIEIATGIKDNKGTELKIGDKTITKMLCAGCNSDNLDMNRTFTHENEKGKIVSDVWCNDCQDFHPAYEAIFKSKKYRVEGFQVVSNDEKGDIHPLMQASFCLYNLTQAREMLADLPGKNLFNEWQLLTIWTGDVEEATKMFKGDPRK
jgi:hypothetical protein